VSTIQTPFSPAPQKRSILIADDDAIFRTVASGLVASWGYTYVAVDNGEAALRALTQLRPPTIAILDWLMPRVTGTEICRQIRSGSCPQYIYFILVSARDGRQDALEGLRSGADAYISKPLDAEELRAKLEIADRILFMEESLRDLHAETEVFINSVPSILIGTDRSGKINRWNQTAKRVFGLSRESVEHRTLGDCGILWAGPGIQSQVEAALQTGAVTRLDELAIRKNDAHRLLALNIHPLRSHLGHITGTMIVGADITEKKSREDQLRQAQKLEAIGQLAAGIAHEINTPTQFVSDNVNFFKESWAGLSDLLASVRKLSSKPATLASQSEGWSEIEAAEKKIDLDYLTQEVPKAIDQTLDGLQRIKKIVRAMKEFSHLGSSKLQPTDLNRAIQNTITVTRSEWKYVADLKTDLDPDLPQVPCLVDQFNQVILNLLVNAAHAIQDATAEGSLSKGLITVTTRKEGDSAQISIADTGKGIPEEIRHRIFEPFFSTKEVGRGTGQGLALAHATIVNEHKGRIWFESEVGKGTVFFIQLPLASSSEAQMTASATGA
jgi:two-component system NtrC family sensor kinase